MEHPNYFSVLPAAVRYDKRLGKPNAKILYSEITALSTKDGYCYASNSYFAKLYDVDSTTISKWISLLVKYGYLEREEIYYQGTKQLKERRLYPLTTPLGAKTKPPLGSNAKDNNTSIKYYIITTYGKVVGNDLINKLDLLSYTDDRQKLDTANVVIRFKDQLNNELLVYGVERVRQNQVHNSNIKNNVAGYLTSVYKHWLDSDITTLEEAKRETKNRYTDDLDNNLYSEAHIEGYNSLAEYKEDHREELGL